MLAMLRAGKTSGSAGTVRIFLYICLSRLLCIQYSCIVVCAGVCVFLYICFSGGCVFSILVKLYVQVVGYSCIYFCPGGSVFSVLV